jgi:hypothetical protein
MSAVALAMGAASCAHNAVVPDRTARVRTNQRDAAGAEAKGVFLTVSGEKWSGPERLDGRVTAVKVTLTNESGRPVRVLYRNFALKGAHGRVYRPIPPVDASRLARSDRPLIVQAYDSGSFWVAPYLEPYYPSLVAWHGPFPYDQYVDRQFDQWPEGLPSDEMRAEALPEGVLGDRGFVAGWLFFADVRGLERRVDFALDVVDGERDTQLAGVDVPMHVR